MASAIFEVQGSDEQWCVMDLATTSGTHEPPESGLIGPSALRGLLLEGAE